MALNDTHAIYCLQVRPLSLVSGLGAYSLTRKRSHAPRGILGSREGGHSVGVIRESYVRATHVEGNRVLSSIRGQ